MPEASSPRRFGVEIEFQGSRQDVGRAIRDAGYECVVSDSYHYRNLGMQWAVCPDSSVMQGGEVKSPILNFGVAEHREMLSNVVEAMHGGGARPHESCGVHVHIDAGGLSAEHLANIVRFFVKFEDPIYRIASSGWQKLRPRASSYCPPLQQYVVEGMTKKNVTMQELGNLAQRVGLNLSSVWSKGTVEFRVFNSTVNPERIQAYVALCHRVVEASVVGAKRKITTGYRLGDMHAGRQPEERVRSYFFGALTKKQEGVVGLSKEDQRRLARCWKDSLPQESISRGW